MTADPATAVTSVEMDQLAAAMVRTIREPLLVLDEALTVLTANPAFYETFQAGPHEILGFSLGELGDHQWDIPPLRERLEAILEGGPPINDFQVEHEFPVIGHRIMSVNARRIEREGQDLILLAIEDTTESVRVRREREELVEQLEESNRELERFAYVASHDLQEPLRMISSYTELLAERYKGELDEKADRYIEYAADGARRMQDMIEGLLQYSRATRLDENMETVDLNQVLTVIQRDVSTALEESGGSLTIADLPNVTGEANRLGQVFRNLISNAIKFRGEKSPEIRVTAEREDGEWRIGVHDNGIGIEPQYADQVFLIFKRLNPRKEYPGAGLGLALCKKIVEFHGGRLEVESELDEGSSFYVILPAREVDDA
ncbi:MAG: ATP-binding protein [Longimicrobiales bacterium]